ncbi:hypothetical protein Trydic_g18151 [Trypoxylus dichotomus]
MRRLLNMLRQSQSYCTDIECYQNVPNTRGVTSQNFMFTCIVMVFALFVFFYHTPMARNNHFEPTKSRRNNNEGDGAPPAPPPTSS